MSKFRREYLNAEEKNFYMISKAFIQTIDGQRNLSGRVTKEVWEEWEKKGMLTREMRKNLKLVRTYLKKFCYEIEENLSDSENKRLAKQLEKFDYKLIDDFTVQKLMRDINNQIKYAVIEREKLEEVLADIAQVRCVGCTTDYKSCEVYKLFDDISTPYFGELPNCPYAADLSECSPEQKQSIEDIKARLRKKNQFYKE